MPVTIKSIASLEGLEGSVYTLERTINPTRLLSGSNDRMVVEWNLETMQPEKVVATLPTKAYALKFIEELNWLIVGNLVGGLHVIDLTKKKEIRLIQLHTKTIFDLQYDDASKRLFSLSADGSFAVWSIPEFELIHHEVLTHLKVRSMAFRPDLKEAAIGCGDGTIRIINTETCEQLIKLEGHEKDHSVNALAYSPSGKRLISGSRDARLNYWNLDDGYDLFMRIPAHNYAIYSIVFHPTKPFFATGSMDKAIRIWEDGQMRPKTTVDITNGGHTNSVNKLLWSDHNDYLISTGDDRTIRVWDVQISD
jgi:WD40 repeat protein